MRTKQNDLEQRITRAAVIGAILAAMGLLLSLDFLRRDKVSGYFESATGVSIRNRFADSWQFKKSGTVYAEDVLWVAPNSEASLRLPDGSKVQLDGGSWVEFAGFEGLKPRLRISLRQENGALAETKSAHIEPIYSPEFSMKEVGQARYISPLKSSEAMEVPSKGLTNRVYTAMSKTIPLEYVSKIDLGLYLNPFSPEDFIPKMLAPKNAVRYPKTAAGQCITFRWLPMPVNGVQYDVQFSKTPYFTSKRSFLTQNTTMRFQLKKSTDLWYRIRAFVGQRFTYSEVQKISLGYPLPYAQQQIPGVMETVSDVEACR